MRCPSPPRIPFGPAPPPALWCCLLFPFQLRLGDTGLLFIVALDFLKSPVNLLVYLFFQAALCALFHSIALCGG